MNKKMLFSTLIMLLLCYIPFAQQTPPGGGKSDPSSGLKISNEFLQLTVQFDDNQLSTEVLEGNNTFWAKQGNAPVSLSLDGDFAIHVTWTDWRAPGRENNGDNTITLTKRDFRYLSHEIRKQQDSPLPDTEGGWMEITFSGIDKPLILKLTYSLEPSSFYFRRKISFIDTTQETHFLEAFIAREGKVYASSKKANPFVNYKVERSQEINSEGTRGEADVLLTPEIVKKGGFGQPLALRFKQAATFIGLEYPGGTSLCTGISDQNAHISCYQEIGEKISRKGVDSKWVVTALVPTPYVKDWFFDYLKDIRVMPAEPYTLYNSWYDLRSPEYPKVQPANIMNQANVFTIADLFKKNMIERHGIGLDAFVLDDGWDIYQSDWKLRPETFPQGLKPLSDKLKAMNTSLGIWMGPSGGYSFRMKRVNWMKEHGYEVVGKDRDHAMLCLGGKNYSALFEKRISDFVRDQGVGYFKWDGIQFSCSEADHGHPTGIFSRKAIIESLIGKCEAVRAINPNTYLNITSGTWLSPWWIKHANQIWMDGADYGYADVPSICKRDAATTYRDYVLYDDFTRKDLWFPIANLMTHGIIKGNLERLGGDLDPIDKFTDDVLLYVARGISMFELYVSPDLLNDREWDAIGKSISWAKDNKETLSKTFMIGGNPAERESYGYVHFKGNRGIVAARNPVIASSILHFTIDPSMGIAPGAANLVVERIYPYRYVYPWIYSAGGNVEIPLEGFETAILEIYPLEEAREPLVAGVKFEGKKIREGDYEIDWFGYSRYMKLLNPEIVQSVTVNGMKNYRLEDFPQVRLARQGLLSQQIRALKEKGKEMIEIVLETDSSAAEAMLSMLFEASANDKNKELPSLLFNLDGKDVIPVTEQEKDCWAWHSIPVNAGKHKLLVSFKDKARSWDGETEAYLIAKIREECNKIILSPRSSFDARILPPSPLPKGTFTKNYYIGKSKFH